MPEYSVTRFRGGFALTWRDEQDCRRRYKLSSATRRAAEEEAAVLYRELTQPIGSKVPDLWKQYLEEKQGRAIITTMGYTWKALQPTFGELEATKITVANCRAHMFARRKAGIRDGTIHTELGHLRTVLNWACKRRLIPFAPYIERPAKSAPRDAFLTRSEFRAAVDAASNTPHLATALHLLLGTAARVEAALQLTWDRVDFEQRKIALQSPAMKSHSKGRAIVPMSDNLIAVLRAARERATSDYVIEYAGRPIKSIKKGLKRVGRSINRNDLSPHVLRHTAAVWLAQGKHPMEEIAQYLGHSDVKTTRHIYARFSPDYLSGLAETLDVNCKSSDPRFDEPRTIESTAESAVFA